MTTHFPGIANSPTPPPIPASNISAKALDAWSHAHLLRHPGDPVVRQRYEFKELSHALREFLSLQIGTHTRDEAARMFWVQGRPGEGKSVGCLMACLNAGYTVAVVSPGLLAGDTEGASVDQLHAILDELARWSVAHKRRVVIQLDDFDLSIAAAAGDDDMGQTVNSKLLVNEFMSLADNRHLYRCFDGSNLAFIMSVNDASGMRESLHRSGRAIWYDHVPSAEDKANVAWSILEPKTTEERNLVAALVRRFARGQPIAFWTALYHKMRALQAKDLIAAGMPSQAGIDQVYGKRLALTPDIAWPAAHDLRRAKVRSWLNKRGLF